MPAPRTARSLFDALQPALALSWLGGEGHRPLPAADDPWAGRMDLVYANHIQVLGEAELDFLDGLPTEAARALVARLFDGPSAAVLACAARPRTDALVAAATGTDVALWHSPAAPTEAMDRITDHQRSLEARTTHLHGVFLEVAGMGVVLTGRSGAGKSELALELISRGHRLIADDVPQLTRVAANVLEGRSPPALHGFLEVRGLGIVNVGRVFGDSAIKRNKRLRLIVELVRLEDNPLPPEARLQGARTTRQILGVAVPHITLPIAPGRNLAVLVECAVRDHMLRLAGYHADQDLAGRLQQEMSREAAPCA